MKLLVIGAGGHAKVVIDVALSIKKYDTILIVDDRYPQLEELLHFPVVGTLEQIPDLIAKENIQDIFIALGDNLRRAALYKQLKNLNVSFVNLIHPSAIISPFAYLQQGILIMPQVVINGQAEIGAFSILNTAAVIEHDCVLEEAVHISPNAALAGGVQIGSETWVGIGAVVKEKIKIGKTVIIGAGAVVVNDIPDNQVVVGCPARMLRYNKV